MAKIVVKIVTKGIGTANQCGGLADYNMLRPLKADVVLSSAATGGIAGGILPITQAEYDRVVA